MEWTDAHTIGTVLTITFFAILVLVACYGDRAKKRRDAGIGFHFGDLFDLFYVCSEIVDFDSDGDSED